jgi:GTP-binding protein Era
MKSLLAHAPGPVLLAVNKTDLVARQDLLPLLDRLNKQGDFAELVPVSARSHEGIDLLLGLITKRLPEGPALFGDTDGGNDAASRGVTAELVQELVQEKLFARLHQEVPYGCAVLVEAAGMDGAMARISAVIITERESHKPILIGAGGSMLKEVGQSAREDLETILGVKVYLKLWVKVEKDWRNREGLLTDLGYYTSG